MEDITVLTTDSIVDVRLSEGADQLGGTKTTNGAALRAWLIKTASMPASIGLNML
jgi:hypothetical protein